MLQTLEFEVIGDPASQGSHTIINGRIVQVNSPKHKAWRKAVTQAAIEALPDNWTPLDEAVELSVIFYLPKPKTVQRDYPTVTPDLDKLVRAVGDSLTDAKVLVDDARIVLLHAQKLYAGSRGLGAVIRVNTLPEV